MTLEYLEEMRFWDEPEQDDPLLCIRCGAEFCECAADPTDPWIGELVLGTGQEAA